MNDFKWGSDMLDSMVNEFQGKWTPVQDTCEQVIVIKVIYTWGRVSVVPGEKWVDFTTIEKVTPF